MDLTPEALDVLNRAKIFAVLLDSKEVELKHVFFSICKIDDDYSTSLICLRSNANMDIVNKEMDAAFKDSLQESKDNPLKKQSSKIEFSKELSDLLDKAYADSKTCGYNFLDTDFILLYLSGSNLMNYLIDVLSIKVSGLVKDIKDSINKKDAKGFQINIDDELLDIFDTSKSPLNKYGRCLNSSTKLNNGKEVISRETEINALIEILNRKEKNNALIIGEAGVGKTAIVEALARKINNGDVPSFLQNTEIWQIDLPQIVAGTKFRGEFEQKMSDLISLSEKKDGQKINIILFIDEIHMIVKSGSVDSSMDTGNILKPALSRGRIQVIGATTFSEYRSSIEKDKALSRRFQTVKLLEPTEEQTFEILKGSKKSYENHHLVRFSDDILKKIISLSSRYLSEKHFPDKAFDIMDLSGSKANIRNFEVPEYLKDLGEKRLIALIELIKEGANPSEATIKKEKKYSNKLAKEQDKWIKGKSQSFIDITYDDVVSSVSDITGIPKTEFKLSDKEKLSKLEINLKTKVFGQDVIIENIVDSIIKAKSGLGNHNRPYCSFLFLGDSGVGKTFLSKKVAELLFGNENKLFYFDMSEFSDKISVSKLTGSTPGYIGYEDGSILIESVRKNPNCVILFDEIEKAHESVLNVFLQILDEGKLTDSMGRSASFKNAIIIFTSNAGCNIVKQKSAGFGDNIDEPQENSQELLRKYFKIEFLNRIDKILSFKSLGKDSYKKIVDSKINDLSCRLKEKNIIINVNEDVKNNILDKIDTKNGAREISKIFDEDIVNKISKAMVFDELLDSGVIEFRLENKEIKYLITNPQF